jgi:hypothetical protein
MINDVALYISMCSSFTVSLMLRCKNMLKSIAQIKHHVSSQVLGIAYKQISDDEAYIATHFSL